MTVKQFKSDEIAKLHEDQSVKQTVVNTANNSGAIYGVLTGLTIGGGITLAAYRSKRFDQMMSTSAKIGIPFFGGLMGYAYSFKNSVRSEKNYPNEWQKKAPVNYVEQTPKLPIHQRVLNQFHDHPIYIAAGVGIPFTVFVAFFQKKMSHLSTVQKFGNFRVLGQMGVLSIVLTTMSLEAFMLRRGKYEEEKQDENPSTA